MRYRLGGRAYPLQHGGSFKTRRDAQARYNLIAGELAAGRNPAAVLHPAAAPARRTFAQWAAEYQASRVDIAEETAKNLSSHLNVMLPTFE